MGITPTTKRFSLTGGYIYDKLGELLSRHNPVWKIGSIEVWFNSRRIYMTNGANRHSTAYNDRLESGTGLVYAGRIYMVNLVISTPIFIKHRNRII